MFDVFSRLSSVTLQVALGLILAVEGAQSLKSPPSIWYTRSPCSLS